jgi:NitT/TauT family transport system substrate-binding protein
MLPKPGTFGLDECPKNEKADRGAAGDLCWSIKSDSPIKSLKDTDGKILAYSTNGLSRHGVVSAFIKQYNLTAKPTT